MDGIAIKIEHVSKEYRLGAIGGGTLRGDLQSWMARLKGKEDPNSKIGSDAATHMGEKFLALDDVSFMVKKGEALGIIGHNGAGKSTLLKLLSRVTAPTKGTISYNGRIASMLEVGTGFHPELTGRENVYMNGAILGMTKAEINRKFDQIVEFAEMEKFIDTPVKRYSSGMYVKLAFAVAAHLDSEIMVIAPFFPEYRPFITANGGKMVVVPADTEAFQVHLDEVERRITPHTQAIIVNSPNNPSGVVYTEETLRGLAALLERKSAE